MIKNPESIVISRTDSIGDVILTLPLVGILRERFPNARLIFLGNTYTKPVLDCCQHLDEVWDWKTLEAMEHSEQVAWLKNQKIDTFIHVFPVREIARLAKKAKIPNRIGTSHRFFHWFTCNYRPSFTRKNSDLHEAQLNTKLLEPLRIGSDYNLTELTEHLGFTKIPSINPVFSDLLSPTKLNVILHCKSQGSAVEWGIENFVELAKSLEPEKFNVFFTGTENEGLIFRKHLPHLSNIHDLSGKMTLSELITFIGHADALVAASTGPLHLAGILNIKTIGLFAGKKPIHSGRWKPLGNNVLIFEDKKISDLTQPLLIPLRDIEKALESTSKK